MTFKPFFNHPFQAGIDGGIGLLIVGSIMNVVPPIAAVIGLLYYAIQLYETKTVQAWLLNHKAKIAARKLARLRARQKVVVAEIEAAEVVRSAAAVATEKVEVAKTEAAIVSSAPRVTP